MMSRIAVPPHLEERLEWHLPGAGAQSACSYAAAIPPRLCQSVISLSAEVAEACATAGLELAVFARASRSSDAAVEAARALLTRVEILGSLLVDQVPVSPTELAKSEANLPATRSARLANAGVGALVAHLAGAERALGLGALAAAHTAPATTPGVRKAARYRATQSWIGGSDLWPFGADYVPPRPEHIPALMDDLVEFLARTDVDPIAQAAIAHAQFLSIQPFPDGNGRAARALLNGVWRRRGLSRGVVVPVSASIAGDRRRYGSAWREYRVGDAEPMIDLVARHALRAVKEATASSVRIAAMPEAWRAVARPRRASAAFRLTTVLAEHPAVNAAEVQRLTGASQASAYEAISTLAEAGVLTRLTLSRRDSVWIAGDLLGETDAVMGRLSAGGRMPASSPRPRPSRPTAA